MERDWRDPLKPPPWALANANWAAEPSHGVSQNGPREVGNKNLESGHGPIIEEVEDVPGINKSVDGLKDQASNKGKKKFGEEDELATPGKKAKYMLGQTQGCSLRLSSRGGLGRRGKAKGTQGVSRNGEGEKRKKTTTDKKITLCDVVVSPSKELEAVERQRRGKGLEESNPL
ncbi:unnamed protein product [Prunus brigantina]